LHSFNEFAHGSLPNGGLVQNGDGLIYGTTDAGGPDGGGIFYSLTTNGVFKILHAFPSGNGTGDPGLLVAGKDGNFYGYASSNIIKLTPSGELTVLHRLTWEEGSGPYAAPVEGPDGAFYGVTSGGGPANGNTSYGTAFRFTSTGGFTLLHVFHNGLDDGQSPLGGLVLGRDGNFYGTTTGGGFGGDGTIYRMTPAGVVTVLHSFDRNHGERTPKAGLTIGPDGALYGTTSSTEIPSMSTLFRLAPGGPGAMEADDTQLPPLVVGPRDGTDASVAAGVLTYTDGATHRRVKYKVRRPFFAAQASAFLAQGPWIWMAKDGRHGSMIGVDASGNVAVTPLTLQMIHTMLGAGR
jgi:uncharacterized repeat protein (TIGR03803 family)